MAVELLKEKFESFFHPGIRKMSKSDQARSADVIITTLDEWIRDVNRVIWSKGQADDKYREMGTTLAMVYALPNVAIIAHVGDSRAYLIRGETISQITTDHSLVNSQVETGLITKEEAATSNQKNIITRAIGTTRSVKPEFDILHMQRNDRLVLCSDGLTDMVEDEVIRQIITENDDSEAALKRLINEANNNGGRDNITILLAHWVE